MKKVLIAILTLAMVMGMATMASAAEKKYYLANRELEVSESEPEAPAEAPDSVSSPNVNANPGTGR